MTTIHAHTVSEIEFKWIRHLQFRETGLEWAHRGGIIQGAFCSEAEVAGSQLPLHHVHCRSTQCELSRALAEESKTAARFDWLGD